MQLQKNNQGFGGGSMKNHGTKQSNLDSLSKSSVCRYTLRRLSVLPISLPSFVRRDAWSPCSKHLGGRTLRYRGGHTHGAVAGASGEVVSSFSASKIDGSLLLHVPSGRIAERAHRPRQQLLVAGRCRCRWRGVWMQGRIG